MTDYTELVKALRETSMDFGELDDVSVMLLDAAAAIEELQALLTEADKKQAYQHDCICELTAENEELQAEVEEQKQIAAHYEQSAKDWWAEACDYYTIASARDITAEESEELIKKFKKLPVGPIEPIKIKPIKPHWVSVKERLPDKAGEYLVAYHPCHWDFVNKGVKVGIDSFRGKSAWAKKKYQRVTHWMPLPEPPKEVQE